MEEIKKKAIETFIDKSEEIIIPLLPKNWFHKILQKVGLKKKELIFTLRKMRTGNRERIAPKLYEFPEFVRDETYILKRVFELTVDQQASLNYVVAVALQNDRNEPTMELLDAVKWLDDEQFSYILEKSIGSIDIENFLKSIILISGTAKLIRTENQ
ncbi:hypothetical protein AAW12_08725 [Sphingobacterium sp. Ag1]|uniref:hypothetical protein n=1 Tax=Sphingobacterium sp. Ag1 TaxID=1643451 RepID=UPI000627A06A|nr:hypothetical protein [Sphingobacterium sp. Ag1]KKO91736.1 hypothetical protein AAW12_08725 [Sphingobacterium sp. Ag1]